MTIITIQYLPASKTTKELKKGEGIKIFNLCTRWYSAPYVYKNIDIIISQMTGRKKRAYINNPG